MPKIKQKLYDIVNPSAKSMIESMRSHGYSTETAIADIIDNSISAGASNVWLEFRWHLEKPFISILDDGCGMTEEELKQSMKAGSKNPLDERSEQDLGRFGLGLKTASFSQARRLSVLSKVKHESIVVRRWDLEYIQDHDEWRLLKTIADGSQELVKKFLDVEHGTMVLWELLDRIISHVGQNEKRFMRLIDKVENHLSMVFHRFIEGQNPRLNIYINGSDENRRVQGWDPFYESHKATYSDAPEPIRCGSGSIKVEGFVLPHKDRYKNEKEYLYAEGPNGWLEQEGFYIYRNDRLLSAGGWMGLGYPKVWTKEEHYKLARIKVDIPNTLDMEWQIDIKKSSAKPPALVREKMQEIAEDIRNKARKVFAHRGKYNIKAPTEKELIRIWKPVVLQGERYYKIDRKHPMLQALSFESNSDKIENLIKLIEETVPVEQIWLDTAEESENRGRPFSQIGDKNTRKIINQVYESLKLTQQMSSEEARKYLMTFEGINEYPEIISTLE